MPLKFFMSPMAINEFIVDMQISKRKKKDDWLSPALKAAIRRHQTGGLKADEECDHLSDEFFVIGYTQ